MTDNSTQTDPIPTDEDTLDGGPIREPAGAVETLDGVPIHDGYHSETDATMDTITIEEPGTDATMDSIPFEEPGTDATMDDIPTEEDSEMNETWTSDGAQLEHM